MSLQNRLYLLAAKSGRIRTLIDSIPVPVTLWDGRRRTLPFRIWRMRKTWTTVPGLPEECDDCYAAYSGGDILDIGAFEGWYPILLAPKTRPGDHIVSFEPDLAAHPALHATQSALSDAFPERAFWLVAQPVGDGSPTKATQPEGAHQAFVSGADTGPPSLTVDSFVAQTGLAPTLIKIDVEGAEWYVLNGALETLRRHRPTVLLEVHPALLPEGVSTDDVVRLMEAEGFEAEWTQRNHEWRQTWRPVAS
jgi:FkbM family methyltransferase